MIGTPPSTPYTPRETQLEVEFVKETQLAVDLEEGQSSKAKGKRVHKKKGPDEPLEKTEKQSWSNKEEMALARAWLEVTEDPEEGNFQKMKIYWKKIGQIFHKILKKEPYRGPDSLSGKWSKMRLNIQKFNEIYTHLNHNPPSGSNDTDIIKLAHREYKATLGEPSTKRSKTTSDSAEPQSQGSNAQVEIDLNTTEEEGESLRERRYYRPGGRDKAKKASRAGSSSSSGKVVYLEEFAQLGEKLEGLIGVGKERVELGKKRVDYELQKIKMKQDEQYNKDMTRLAMDTSRLIEVHRVAVETMKQRIREKHNLSLEYPIRPELGLQTLTEVASWGSPVISTMFVIML
uniref:uncharacterized protein LOC122591659 n=1 Tax=Erigeron canadensis TaxID=72917 RepID=UPI001CB90597|nr:uncharacterized protein LOC122591659 [Erigeron canadensis]